MRTTLTIDDQLMMELKERAHRDGVSFKHVVNRTLRRGLEADIAGSKRKPFRTKTFAMGEPLVTDLDKSLAIASGLEDEEIARKLSLRK